MKADRVDSGQITVYFAMVFTLLLSVFLTAFEYARQSSLKVHIDCMTENTVNSLFAGYNRELLDRYDLLFIDLSYQTSKPSYANAEKQAEEILNRNMFPDDEHFLFARDWYDLKSANTSITGARLATDNDGEAVFNQAVSYMKDRVSLSLLSNVNSWIEITETYNLDGDEFKEKCEKLTGRIENTDPEKPLSDSETWDETGEKHPDKDGLIEISPANLFNRFAKSVNSNISDKRISTASKWKKGNTAVGNWPESESGFIAEAADGLIFDEYVFEKLGYQGHQIPNSALDYGGEYVLVGGESDTENLLAVYSMLFFVRGAADFVTISKTEKCVETAETIGAVFEALTGFSKDFSKEIVLVYWSGLEAMYDLKELARGRRISLVKTPEEIHTQPADVLLGESASFDFEKQEDEEVPDIPDTSEGSEEQTGEEPVPSNVKLAYIDYLRIFLAAIPADVKTERAMNLIECSICLTPENRYFKFNSACDALEMQITFESGYGYIYTTKRKYRYF
ncbi:MAG: DUF5702 domain-containing protein [Lachnospiraceae bacterium]|nr:DUF5702 domain-containing protein [Lachnospiraceae bacterium]